MLATAILGAIATAQADRVNFLFVLTIVIVGHFPWWRRSARRARGVGTTGGREFCCAGILANGRRTTGDTTATWATSSRDWLALLLIFVTMNN